MPAPRKYPDEIRQPAVRLVRDRCGRPTCHRTRHHARPTSPPSWRSSTSGFPTSRSRLRPQPHGEAAAGDDHGDRLLRFGLPQHLNDQMATRLSDLNGSVTAAF